MGCGNVNRKGWLLGEKVVSTVLSVLVVLAFIYLLFLLYGWSVKSTQEAKAVAQLEKITGVAQVVFKDGRTATTEIFPPGEDWIIRTFPDYNFPTGQCQNAVGCVCLCDALTCIGIMKCEGFDFDIIVDEIYKEQSGVYGSGDFAPLEFRGGLDLSEIEQLTLAKEETKVVIRRSI